MLARAIVTAELPLNEVPDKPVPIVKALVVLEVIVPEAPKATVTPLKVTELLAKPVLGIVVLIALAGMLIVVLDAAVN